MAVEVSAEELESLLSGEGFVKVYGFKLHTFSEGEATIVMPYQKTFERPGGVVSGPTYMAAADLAMWLAIIAKIGMEEGRMTVTAEMKTSFISVCKNEDFYCRSKLLKVGKRLVYGVAECVTAADKLLTHHTLTYIRP